MRNKLCTKKPEKIKLAPKLIASSGGFSSPMAVSQAQRKASDPFGVVSKQPVIEGKTTMEWFRCILPLVACEVNFLNVWVKGTELRSSRTPMVGVEELWLPSSVSIRMITGCLDAASLSADKWAGCRKSSNPSSFLTSSIYFI